MRLIQVPIDSLHASDYLNQRHDSAQPDFLDILTTQGAQACQAEALGRRLERVPPKGVPPTAMHFSPAAQAVFDAAREVWRYYHAQPKANPNASFYDIREFFQGRNAKGVMNPDSKDAGYNAQMAVFKEAYAVLAAQIEPKIYSHGFLMK